MIASIPSPSSSALEIGPLSIHAYGLMIALGVLAAAWLASRRLEASGLGTRDDMSAITIWAMVGAIVGSRLYHVATDWGSFDDDLPKIFRIWEGGLGIPGGMLIGIPTGCLVARRRGLPVAPLVTICAPAIPLGQAIGRWGNWFNQELFGKATDLPWALRIDDENLPPGYAPGTTFHPTFLYESLWSLALCGLLLVIDRRVRLRPGRLMAVFVVGYCIGRFWIEGLRIDPAKEGGGLRLNQWVALGAGIVAVAFLIIDQLRHRRESGDVEIDEYVAADE